MKILFLMLLTIFLITSCGDESSKSECSPSCEKWESCVDKTCQLKEGRCLSTSDCKTEGEYCNLQTHACEQDICTSGCDEWETCIEKTCELKEGRCNIADGCDIEGTICNLETHLCDFDIPINWGSCPSYITVAQECATVMMPYNYDDLSSERVPVFVFRYKTNSTNKKGQIWFLQGGPGGSGAVFDDYFGMLKNRYPGWDMYSLDHRGVGNSEKLVCSNEWRLGALTTTPADITKCVGELTTKYGENIKTFSATGASKDLGKLIELLKEDGKQVFVYGVSYGTFWAHRYLQLFPTQSNGVILDSIALNGYCFLDNYDKLANEVGKQFMELCKDDTTCFAKMSTIAETPWEAMGVVFDKIKNGEICEDFSGYAADDLKGVLFYMLAGGAYTRNLIPPMMYRINRCSQDDVAVISTFINNMFGGKKADYVPENELDSNILYYNVAFNELWSGIEVQEALDLNETYYVSTNGVAGNALIGKSGLWPVYDEPFLTEYSTSETPILMLNGTLDPQTPLEIAIPAKDKFTKAHQTFITAPYSAHGVMTQTVTMNSINGGPACGEKIIFNFINDPTAEVTTECFEDLIPVEFGNSMFNQYMSSYLFGTTDMWEGGLQKSTIKENKTIEQNLRIIKRTNYKLFKDIQKRIKK